MHDASDLGCIFLLENADNILVSITIVNDDRLSYFARQTDLLAKYTLLNVFRRGIPMIVKPDFANSNNLLMRA